MPLPLVNSIEYIDCPSMFATKSAPSHRGLELPSNVWFLGAWAHLSPHTKHTQLLVLKPVDLAIFAWLMVTTKRQTTLRQ